MTIHSAIQEAIKRSNLVFFIGAGFSKPLGLPNWTDLVKIITDELKKDYPTDSYIANIVDQIKQGYFTEIEALDKLKQKHHAKIVEILDQNINIHFDGKDLTRHEKLWQITDQIITTNYDKAFEQVAPKRIESLSYSNNFHIAQLSNKERFLFKVHGCIERPEECVLFSNQYNKLYDGQTGATLELFKILSDKTIIFIGFSLTDPYVNELLQLRQKAYSGLKYKNFIITTDTRDFSDLGVEKVTDINNYSEDLDKFLNELLPIREKYPYGLGMLLRGFDREGREYNEDDIRKKYFDLLVPMEQKTETTEIADELKSGEFENAEEKLKKELYEELNLISERKESAAQKAFDLANLYEIQLKYEDALNYCIQAVNLLPKNSNFLNDLGRLFHILGKQEKAIEYYEKALVIEFQEYGDKDSKVALIYNNIGLAWFKLGNSKKAIEYFERVLDIESEIHSSTPSFIALQYNNIGLAWNDLGKLKKALEYFENALNIDLKVYDNTHPAIAIDYNNIGMAWDNLGDSKKAIEYFQKALAINLNVYNDNHPKISILYNNIGLALGKLNESKKAIEYFEKALAIDLKVYGNKHPSIAIRYNNIGIAWDELGKSKEAIEYFEKALAIDLETYGSLHPSIATRYNNIGMAWVNLGESKKAIKYFENALDIDLKVFGNTHPNIALSYNNIGLIWSNLGEPKKAIEYFENALDIDLKVYDNTHPDVASDYNNLGLTWNELGESKKAINYLSKALKILMDKFGENHPKTQSVTQSLIRLNKQK